MKIVHDVHTHTNLSQCSHDPEALIPNYIKKAAELGHKIFGISNHLWDPKAEGASGWYKSQMTSYGLQLKDCIPEDTCGVKVLFGVETDFFGKTGALGMLAETAKQFDYVLIPHSHTHMRNICMPDSPDVVALKKYFAENIKAALPALTEAQAMTMASSLSRMDVDKMIADGTFLDPTIDFFAYIGRFLIDSFHMLMDHPELNKMIEHTPVSLAHSMYPCGHTHEELEKIFASMADEEIVDCYRRAAKLGIAVEVNTSCFSSAYEDDYTKCPYVHVMALAKQAGCKFTFGTDGHSVKSLDGIRKGDILADAIGLTDDDLAEWVKA